MSKCENTTHLNLLKAMFKAAIESAQPAKVLLKHLPKHSNGRIVVIGAGKASAAMAKVLESHYGDLVSGCVVTRYDYQTDCKHIKIIQAAHPIPDANSELASREILNTVTGLNKNDLVICLISGGGSSLLALPATGLNLEEKQKISKQLMHSGANISEINTVRRHLSAIKGGRLAKACYPAQVLNLIISDVAGDTLHDIASGPTVFDPSTNIDALNILKKYKINISEQVSQLLENTDNETIKSDDKHIKNVTSKLIATPHKALLAAAEIAKQNGVNPIILSDQIEGESTQVAKVLAAISKHTINHGQPFKTPCVLISGGETTVSIKGNGCGGSNVEFLLALATELNGITNVYALAGDTDGIDGAAEIAGATIDPSTLKRAHEMGLSAIKFLDNNDAHNFFQQLGDSIITGPTMTNVNDFRAILIKDKK